MRHANSACGDRSARLIDLVNGAIADVIQCVAAARKRNDDSGDQRHLRCLDRGDDH